MTTTQDIGRRRWTMYWCKKCDRPTAVCVCDGNLGWTEKAAVVPAADYDKAVECLKRVKQRAEQKQLASYSDLNDITDLIDTTLTELGEAEGSG